MVWGRNSYLPAVGTVIWVEKIHISIPHVLFGLRSSQYFRFMDCMIGCRPFSSFDCICVRVAAWCLPYLSMLFNLSCDHCESH